MDEYGMDMNDVSWLDQQEDLPRVKTLNRHMVRSQNLEQDESLVCGVS